MRKHPFVDFARCISVLIIACSTNNPVALTILLLGSFVLIGKNKAGFYLGELAVVMTVTLVNVLTNHRGETFLFYMNDNVITLESIVYGIVLGTQIVALCNLCMYLSRNMTSEKVVIVCSYLSPSLSLLVSMSIRSVNRYKNKLVEIFRYQKSQSSQNSWFELLFISLRTISILINWSLENGIETSDSMKCRGYGSCRRTSYSPVSLVRKDVEEIIMVVILVVLFEMTQPWVLISPRIEVDFSIANTIILLTLMLYVVTEDKSESKYNEENNK